MENQKLFKTASAEKKTSQQQGEYKARTRLGAVKNKFINLLMRNGEKGKAQKLFELSLNQLQSTNHFILDQTFGESCDKKNQTFFEGFIDQSKRKKAKKTSIEKANTNDRLPYGLKRKSVALQPVGYTKDDLLKNNTLYQAVENVKPTLELRRVRKGGTTYQVPAIVSQKRQERLAIKWIIESAEKRKKRNKSSFSNCLVKEIVEAFNKTGQPRQKRDEQLKIAEYNRAYTRYRWW